MIVSLQEQVHDYKATLQREFNNKTLEKMFSTAIKGFAGANPPVYVIFSFTSSLLVMFTSNYMKWA